MGQLSPWIHLMPQVVKNLQRLFWNCVQAVAQNNDAE
jgi:hypothetical protein